MLHDEEHFHEKVQTGEICILRGERYLFMKTEVGEWKAETIRRGLDRDDSFRPGVPFGYAPIETVLMDVDILTLHCPPRDEPVLCSRALSGMKEGVVIINTA